MQGDREQDDIVFALGLVEGQNIVTQRAKPVAKRIVGERPPRNVDVCCRYVDRDDVMAVARKFERDVAGAASDIENALLRATMPPKQLEVGLHDLSDIEPDELRVAPKALIKILALHGATKIGNEACRDALADSAVKRRRLGGEIADLNMLRFSRHRARLRSADSLQEGIGRVTDARPDRPLVEGRGRLGKFEIPIGRHKFAGGDRRSGSRPTASPTLPTAPA